MKRWVAAAAAAAQSFEGRNKQYKVTESSLRSHPFRWIQMLPWWRTRHSQLISVLVKSTTSLNDEDDWTMIQVILDNNRNSSKVSS